MANKVFWQGIALMTGCIIGGGVLALPFAVAQSGFWSAILLIVVLGLIMLFINLRIGDVSVAMKKPHQLVGLVERFLGKQGKILMTFAMLLLSYGALIAYAIGCGRILSVMGGSELMWRIGFYIVGAFIVVKGIQVISGSELFLETIKLAIVGIIVILGMNNSVTLKSFSGFTFNGVGMVFGIALFAYLGFVSVPAVYELKPKLKEFKKIIIIGSIIPIFVYLLFIATVIARTGSATTEVATIGLQQVFSPVMGILINIFALLALATSFLAVSYALYDMFIRDFLLSKTKSFLLAFVPSLIGMFFLESFAKTIDIAGAIAGSMMAILMIFAHRVACKQFKKIVKIPLFVDVIITVVFVAGAVFAIV